jgi:hypothetical protein
VHPDQLHTIELLMPAARTELGPEGSAAAAELLAAANLRAATNFTSAALLEAWRSTTIVGAA